MQKITPWLSFNATILGLAVVLLAAGCGGGGDDAGPADEAAERSPLLNPDSPEMNRTAPDTFQARFRTNEGEFTIEVYREWAPRGADRFYNLVRNGFYDGARFFRVMDGFMVQFGLSGDPDVNRAWMNASIQDDPVMESNTPGTVSFAMRGEDTRTTQVFINYGDNSNLDDMGFAPFGRVVEGMDVAESLHSGYGDVAPRGSGPSVRELYTEGNAYLEREFPELDYIEEATIVSDPAGGDTASSQGSG